MEVRSSAEGRQAEKKGAGPSALDITVNIFCADLMCSSAWQVELTDAEVVAVVEAFVTSMMPVGDGAKPRFAYRSVRIKLTELASPQAPYRHGHPPAQSFRDIQPVYFQMCTAVGLRTALGVRIELRSWVEQRAPVRTVMVSPFTGQGWALLAAIVAYRATSARFLPCHEAEF